MTQLNTGEQPTPNTTGLDIYDGVQPTAAQQQLVAFFAEIEKKQVDFLDEAGKRIIELSTLLLGTLFTVIAFGDKFPPPYLAGSPLAKVISLVILICYVFAMAAAFFAVQPREYTLYRHNLDGMRRELSRIITYKRRALFIAGFCFWVGSACLATLVALIIWTA